MTPPPPPGAPAPPGVLAALQWACARDLRLAMRSRSELALIVVFFLLVTSLFPLAVSPDPELLRTIAAGIVWVAALLASLLGLARLFAADHGDGTLEQMVLAPAPLPALVAGKVLAHWTATGLPLVLLAPLAGLQFGLGLEAIGVLVAACAARAAAGRPGADLRRRIGRIAGLRPGRRSAPVAACGGRDRRLGAGTCRKRARG